MPNIIAVVPSIRPASMDAFRAAWRDDFERHGVTTITVWDGERPSIEWDGFLGKGRIEDALEYHLFEPHRDLFCRRTDAVRNLGFVFAATLAPDYILTLDDDCYPRFPADNINLGPDAGDRYTRDPIRRHLDALKKRVPLAWMNTAQGDSPYLRGVPYCVRDRAPVMLSHGVWDGVPDFDGETQLRLQAEGKFFSDLPYYVGPIPRGVKTALCGMNVMVTPDALPYLYYAPQGADCGFPDLHRMADIFMGLTVRQRFDELGWAVYTGASKIYHSRASDPHKNVVQERLGRQWLEELETGNLSKECARYFLDYGAKAERYAKLVADLLEL